MKKNALVKVRLCPDCSWKLNYRKKMKEVTKTKEKKDKKRKRDSGDGKQNERLDEKVAKMREEEKGWRLMWIDSSLLHLGPEKQFASISITVMAICKRRVPPLLLTWA